MENRPPINNRLIDKAGFIDVLWSKWLLRLMTELKSPVFESVAISGLVQGRVLISGEGGTVTYDDRLVSGSSTDKYILSIDGSACGSYFNPSTTVRIRQYNYTNYHYGLAISANAADKDGLLLGCNNTTGGNIDCLNNTGASLTYRPLAIRARSIDLNTNGTNRFSIDIDGNIYNYGDVYITSLAAGSVLFAGEDGKITQNNSSLFWDNTKKMLYVKGDLGLIDDDLQYDGMYFYLENYSAELYCWKKSYGEIFKRDFYVYCSNFILIPDHYAHFRAKGLLVTYEPDYLRIAELTQYGVAVNTLVFDIFGKKIVGDGGPSGSPVEVTITGISRLYVEAKTNKNYYSVTGEVEGQIIYIRNNGTAVAYIAGQMIANGGGYVLLMKETTAWVKLAQY